jgi:hypothetical protein
MNANQGNKPDAGSLLFIGFFDQLAMQPGSIFCFLKA